MVSALGVQVDRLHSKSGLIPNTLSLYHRILSLLRVHLFNLKMNMYRKYKMFSFWKLKFGGVKYEPKIFIKIYCRCNKFSKFGVPRCTPEGLF